MAIPPCGTFAYVGVIPDTSNPDAGRWPLRDASGAPSKSTGDSLFDDRLVGLHPSLEIEDAGLVPDVRVSPHTGTVRPTVSLSQVTLRASVKHRATVAAFSFCMDRALAASFRSGDVVHLARTSCGGLGLSLLRGTRLIAAIGAVTAVPLGECVRTALPADAINESERVFSRLDPEFAFREFPIDIQINSQRRILYRGRPSIAGYEVFVEHGFYPGEPGTDECVSIALIGHCPDVAAICSAQLLEYEDLHDFIDW
jgi:hypothetical protein